MTKKETEAAKVLWQITKDCLIKPVELKIAGVYGCQEPISVRAELSRLACGGFDACCINVLVKRLPKSGTLGLLRRLMEEGHLDFSDIEDYNPAFADQVSRYFNKKYNKTIAKAEKDLGGNFVRFGGWRDKGSYQ